MQFLSIYDSNKDLLWQIVYQASVAVILLYVGGAFFVNSQVTTQVLGQHYPLAFKHVDMLSEFKGNEGFLERITSFASM